MSTSVNAEPSTDEEIEEYHERLMIGSWETKRAKRKCSRAQASARYYASHPEAREKKRASIAEKRAAEKARRRRWDPPKHPKPSLRKDSNTPIDFPTQDPTRDTSNIKGKRVQHVSLHASQTLYETHMETGANPRSEDIMADYNDSDREASPGQGLSLNRPDEETAAAETLAGFASLSNVRNISAPRDMREGAGDSTTHFQSETTAVGQRAGALGGDEMSSSCSSDVDKTSRCTHSSPVREGADRAQPAIIISIEAGTGTDTANPDASPEEAPGRTRVFRGYRYMPSGPPPDVRPVNEPRHPALEPAQGICGNCKTVEACEADGDDQEGLCARCSDCQMERFLCWDHFNGVKEWEEPWLW
ncbi:hypothetical protein C8R43DRAFT_949022 [Mycena crocata]|nr:hypothetical protein C8R43DRAFT_949022 [Mycena crocata]